MRNPISMFPGGTASALRRWLPTLFLLCVGASAKAEALGCGGLENSFGPYDYRQYYGTPGSKSSTTHPLYLVEMAHFRPEMEMLIRGGQGVKSEVGPEFDYTLRAFPNHHRALNAMTRLADKQGLDQAKGARYTVDCWFQRAIQFRSDDVVVRMLYATYLGSKQQRNEALAQLKFATTLDKDNPFTAYNIGMVYIDLKAYDLALQQALKARDLGMTRTELRDRLSAAGQWKEAIEAPAEAASSSSPEAAASR